MRTAVFYFVNHIVMFFTGKVNSQTDLSANFAKTITRRLQNAKTACKTVKSYGRYQLVKKYVFKKVPFLNPYPQTPSPREGAECGAAALTPLGATPQTPFSKKYRFFYRLNRL